MTIPEVPPVPGTPDEPDVPDQPSPSGPIDDGEIVEISAHDSGAGSSEDQGSDGVSERTRIQDERDALRRAGADRSPTVQEELAAEEAERQIESELGSVAEHHQEMTRLGAALEGEGRLP
jgi:hypothetical protein